MFLQWCCRSKGAFTCLLVACCMLLVHLVVCGLPMLDNWVVFYRLNLYVFTFMVLSSILQSKEWFIA
jgi:hypothetical protein